MPEVCLLIRGGKKRNRDGHKRRGELIATSEGWKEEGERGARASDPFAVSRPRGKRDVNFVPAMESHAR